MFSSFNSTTPGRVCQKISFMPFLGVCFLFPFKAFLTAHPREFMSNKVEVVKNNPNNRIGELDKEYLSTLSVSEQAKYIESKWDEL